MARIFINYRREDTDDWAHTVATRLIAEFGRDAVFIDVDQDLPPGLDYRREIETAVSACDLMISVIGRDWRRTLEERRSAHEGGGRLDLVRVEIAKALGREIPVIPLLVDRTAMPTSADLPAEIAELAYRESRGLRLVSQQEDLDRLVAGVKLLFERDGGGADPAPAPAPVAAPPSPIYEPLSIFRDPLRSGGEGPEMVVIPAGKFLMGSPEGEGRDNERPQHEVTLAKPFALGRFAVTFEEYDAFSAASGAKKPDDEGWGRGRRPVINVYCEDVQAYCAWLARESDAEYRLPSEAEWEYACRAGTTTAYSTGEAISHDQANFDFQSRKTMTVDAYPPNPWGLAQMHGNVGEWCADAWTDHYRGAPSDGLAWMSGEISVAVLRGGSWSNEPEDLRSAYRFRSRRDDRDNDIGFRVARTLPP